MPQTRRTGRAGHPAGRPSPASGAWFPAAGSEPGFASRRARTAPGRPTVRGGGTPHVRRLCGSKTVATVQGHETDRTPATRTLFLLGASDPSARRVRTGHTLACSVRGPGYSGPSPSLPCCENSEGHWELGPAQSCAEPGAALGTWVCERVAGAPKVTAVTVRRWGQHDGHGSWLQTPASGSRGRPAPRREALPPGACTRLQPRSSLTIGRARSLKTHQRPEQTFLRRRRGAHSTRHQGHSGASPRAGGRAVDGGGRRPVR